MALRLVPTTTNLNFLRWRFLCAAVSLVLIIVTGALLGTKGLNFGIDFAGGTLVQVQIEKPTPVSDIRGAMQRAGWEGLVIQEYGSPNEILIRMPGDLLDPSQAGSIASDMSEALVPVAGEIEVRRVEYVGPQIGDELKRKGLMAIILSAIAILIYVSVRFEFRFAVGAVVALIHDIVLTVGLFSFTQKEISMPVLAALLTIIGYSLNDTIVVFDRVRENMRKFKKKQLTDVLNLSVNEMLNRTLMMTLTTLVVLIALFVYGGEVIHDFAFALIVGVVVGTYSSTYIAAPVVLWMNNKNKTAEQQALEEDANNI